MLLFLHIPEKYNKLLPNCLSMDYLDYTLIMEDNLKTTAMFNNGAAD
jgi:hypothetical protein